jgi:hypothetical protein
MLKMVTKPRGFYTLWTGGMNILNVRITLAKLQHNTLINGTDVI